ncbi:MAG: HD domain-containing protein [Sulfurimonadaceae bacterium]|nr:HD domain-containing protein [Sulfurimonadaceae bacterium]
MKKVVQQHIDHQYFPLGPSFLKIGTTIEFDCYIKRFKDYVVIIESGTQITQELYDKICKHDRIYIEQSDRVELQKYREANPDKKTETKSEEVPDVDKGVSIEDLGSQLSRRRLMDEKISLLYESGVTLVGRCLEAPENDLPMKDMMRYAKILTDFIMVQKYRFEQLLSRMPNSYHETYHAVDVAILAAVLSKALNLTSRQIEDIILAGLLHDIGKRRVDASILSKETQLDEDEYEKVREHAMFSAQIVRDNKVNNPQILSAIRYHHEKLDGTGYPNALVGNQIPIMAQILGVCDVFDALTTERTFRARYSSFEALKLMKRDMAREINTIYIDHLIMLLKK